MHKDEVDLFVKGLENAKSEFYLDSINEFKKLIMISLLTFQT